jgi:hypothetical protein
VNGGELISNVKKDSLAGLKRLGKVHLLVADFLWQESGRRNSLIYWFLLSFVITEVVTYSQGFNFSPPPLISIPIQVLLVIFIAELLPKVVLGPIQVLQIMTALLLTIPTIILTFTNSTNIELRFRLFSLIIVLTNQVMISFFDGSKGCHRIERRTLAISEKNIAYLLMSITICCMVIALYSGVLNLNFVSFSEIYIRRSELMSALGNSDLKFLAYVLGWLGGAIIPITFFLGIRTHSVFIILSSIMLNAFSYVLTAQKWILASLFLILVLHMITKMGNRTQIFTKDVFIGFNYLITILIFAQAILPKLPVLDLGVRRAILDPSIMLQYYTKFTDYYPLQWWSDSNFSRFFSDSDPTPVSKIIGDRFFNLPSRYIYPSGTSTNATAGSIADSIAQGGFLGLLVVSLILVGVFYILQILSIGRNLAIVFVLSGLFVEMLAEGTFHTLLLSRGAILIFLVFLLLPRSQDAPTYSGHGS